MFIIFTTYVKKKKSRFRTSRDRRSCGGERFKINFFFVCLFLIKSDIDIKKKTHLFF